METGKLIKELRIKKGMTQEELAEKTEVSARTIQRIENGEVDPRAYTLQMIAKALEVDFNMLVENGTNKELETPGVHDSSWLAVLHFSGIVPLIFPTVIIWNKKKDEVKCIDDHYRDVLSFQLTIWVIILGGFWVLWKAHQPMPLIGILFLNAFVSIMNTAKVMGGKPYKHFSFFRNKQKKV